MQPSKHAPVRFECRPATASDLDFLLALYTNTREDLDGVGLDEDQKKLLIEMQFNAQRQQYAFAFPRAEHQIVEVDHQPVGRTLVNKDVGELRLVDVALMQSYRGHGIGTALLKDLQQEAVNTKRVVRLQVKKSNPATGLYLRLEFRAVHDDGTHLVMEWSSEGQSASGK